MFAISNNVIERMFFLASMLVSFLFHITSSVAIPISNTFIQNIYMWFALLVQLCFKPTEVFFHEASHALVGMAFGREIYNLSINWRGFGQVRLEEAGMVQMAITAFAGYAGAAIWGYLIYVSSLHEKQYTRAFLFLFCLAFLYLCSDLESVLIVLTIMLVFFLSWFFERIGNYLLRFIGVFIMVSAVYSPTYLFKYTDGGDHIVMQSLTGISSQIWIGCWLVIAAYCLWQAFQVLKAKSQFERSVRDNDFDPRTSGRKA